MNKAKGAEAAEMILQATMDICKIHSRDCDVCPLNTDIGEHNVCLELTRISTVVRNFEGGDNNE